LELKQVIVVRRDLRMGRGKLAVQVAHAAVSAYVEASRRERRVAEEWLRQGQKKIVVRVDSEDELVEIYRRAVGEGLPVALVEDAGLTQLPPGTKTAVGIGPACAERIDRITGRLKLL